MAKQLKTIPLPAKLGFVSYLGDVQGCGTIRILHPFLLLNHYRTQNQIQVISQPMNYYIFEVDFYKNFTFAQFQRSATEQHFNIFVHFKTQVQKKYKVPLIYEIDDLLLGIPDYNYATGYYKHNEDWIKKCMNIADGMTVSTVPLMKIYSEYQKNITVVPNHLPKFIWGDIFPAHEYYEPGRKIKILWSGSQNHFAKTGLTGKAKGGDFGQKFLDFIKKTTGVYDWYFVGALPEELEPIKNKLCWIPWKHIFDYPKTVKDIEPDLTIAPLVDNIFNSCKSNIKMLEFTALGAPGIYSNVEPYRAAKVKVRTDEEMISEVERLASDVDARANVFRHDYNVVRNQLWWEESGNIKKYINSYLNLFGQKLP